MKARSLYRELVQLIFLSFVVSMLFFLVFHRIGRNCIDYYYNSAYTEEKANIEMIKKLQTYIDEKELSIDDLDEITKWVKEQKDLANLQIFVDDHMYYDSEYPNERNWNHNPEEGYYDWLESISLNFRDGRAKAVAYRVLDHTSYDMAYVAVMILSILLFSILILLGIRHKIKYINMLKEEIELLEVGVLDEEITIMGDDELAKLAQGLDQMRLAFAEERNAREEMERKNEEVLTTLSHELRTPLAAILLWMEVIKQTSITTEEERQNIIDDITKNGEKIHELADKLIEHMLIK